MADKTRVIARVEIEDDVLQQLLGAVKRADEIHLEVGIFEGSIATYATYNEFGGKNNNPPERSFMRTAFDENVDAYAKVMIKGLDRLLKGKGARGTLTELGIDVQRHARKKITDLRTPANAESTKRKKKSSNPLIDDGFMRQTLVPKIKPGKVKK